jgi:hypothetical protein
MFDRVFVNAVDADGSPLKLAVIVRSGQFWGDASRLQFEVMTPRRGIAK